MDTKLEQVLKQKWYQGSPMQFLIVTADGFLVCDAKNASTAEHIVKAHNEGIA